VHEVVALWNREAVKDGYKELTEAGFAEIFTDNPYFDPEGAFVWLDQNQMVKGFACGCTGEDLPLGQVAGYITCVIGSEEYYREESVQQMIGHLEAFFRRKGKKQAELLFFNPMRLPWYIPGTPQHEHNNAPGVPVDGKLYPILLNQGYVERSREIAMYLQLDSFVIPPDVLAKETEAGRLGYRIGLFDPGKHSGVGEMLLGFDNPQWQQQIPGYLAEGVPVVIAACEAKTVGFAGPVIREDNGRAFFAGIGVHPAHEGHGLGSVLFFRLCEAFKQRDTVYMSLFTGRTNPALRIYEKAGFRQVREFAVMRKEL
jgi:ribosomal protein S18 acetylase RimI-like enzyme